MNTERTGACPFCDSAYVHIWHVRERRFGGTEFFEVGECATCPALVLLHPPADPAAYYPPEYDAFSRHGSSWRRPLRRLRNRILLGRRGWLRRVAARLRPHDATRFLDRTGATPRTRVLDVGAGGGRLLEDLADAGFERLLGVDLHIPQPIDGHGFRVIQGALADIDERFDLVMLHHSLEHMRDPRAALRHVARVLEPGGWCVIRVPVFPSAAWERYHEHWFQLDVPRHEYIFSVPLLTRLAAEAGLRVEGVEYDSTGHQFAGSEGYRRGLRLRATQRHFAARQMRRWRREAREINAQGRGDQAIFYLRRATPSALAEVAPAAAPA